jgi:serine/threonine-protein phosphatase 6 regulatory subunit 3
VTSIILIVAEVCILYSSSLFSNSNWFTFDGDRGIKDRLAASVPSSSPNSEETSLDMEGTDKVLAGEGEAAVTDLQLETVCLENGPAEESEESAVVRDTDTHTDDEKLVFTEEENLSKEPEASERPVDVQGDQVDTQAVDTAEVSRGEMGRESTANEWVSSCVPDIASANCLDTDNQPANRAASVEPGHDSSKGLEVEGDLSAEGSDEKKSDAAITRE